jgi:hypothetical protein
MQKALELGSCLYALLGAAVVAWGIWRAWVRPKDSQTVDLAQRPSLTSWSLRGELARLFLVEDGTSNMSSPSAQVVDKNAGDGQVRHQVPEPVSVSAEPNTDDTEPVSDAAGVSLVDTDARAIIRASLIAELLDSGLLTNRDKAIMQAFRCSKASSSRPEAPFQVALRLVEQHRAKRTPEYISDMIDRVKREVANEQA